ncbi:Anaphase-promoting complex subunit 10 [Sorochytrium milnesiophthora]
MREPALPLPGSPSGAAAAAADNDIVVHISDTLDFDCGDAFSDHGYRDVSNQCVWTVSSSKPDYGVRHLLDDSPDTYWQSDGACPHHVTMQFATRTTFSHMSVYLDYTRDESYTPREVSVRAGGMYSDLETLVVVELDEPSGWVHFPLRVSDALPSSSKEGDEEETAETTPLRALWVQLCVHSNHQSGKDTHVRQVKIFATAEAKKEQQQHLPRDRSAGQEQECELYPSTDPTFKQWEAVR